MLKTLINNLSKNQKIAIAVVLQFALIIVVALVARSFLAEKKHVELAPETTNNLNLPAGVKDYVADNIWEVVKSNIPDANDNSISDVVIREGSYVESRNEDGSIRADFLVDIDSLKQTYKISTGWTANGRTVREVIVNCPPISEMKYKETVCHGMYNDSYSLDLYFPYESYPDRDENEAGDPLAPNYMLDIDEQNKVITITVSVCNVDRFKSDALNYLDTIPIDLSDYKLDIQTNSINVEC